MKKLLLLALFSTGTFAQNYTCDNIKFFKGTQLIPVDSSTVIDIRLEKDFSIVQQKDTEGDAVIFYYAGELYLNETGTLEPQRNSFIMRTTVQNVPVTIQYFCHKTK